MSAASAPENEFSDVGTSSVVRRWVNISTGGHLSGVSWGTGPAEFVLVAPSGGQARDLDAVALALDRPAIVLDLPGTGRSSGPATTPRRAGRAVAEAIASFGPRAQVWAGVGDGATAVLSAAARAGRPVGLLLLVDPDLTDDVLALVDAATNPVAVARTDAGPVSDSLVEGLRVRDVPVTDLGVPASGLGEALAAHLRRTVTVPTS